MSRGFRMSETGPMIKAAHLMWWVLFFSRTSIWFESSVSLYILVLHLSFHTILWCDLIFASLFFFARMNTSCHGKWALRGQDISTMKQHRLQDVSGRKSWLAHGSGAFHDVNKLELRWSNRRCVLTIFTEKILCELIEFYITGTQPISCSNS